MHISNLGWTHVDPKIEKTQLPREPPDPLPDPLPVVVVFIEDVDDPEDDVKDDPEDPGGEQVLAPVSWESIQFLKWLT